MDIRVTDSYHKLRVQELELTSDYLAKVAEEKLNEIQDALDGISRRAANIRAGHVYVISNVGAFGPQMVKIGMTRRLDPMDRVRELGDASVPFHYDVHAIVFSDDAVSLETRLHHQFAGRRVNLVNMRREFFRTSPAEVRDALLSYLDASIVSWVDEPEALEWRQSETTRRQHGAAAHHDMNQPAAPAT